MRGLLGNFNHVVKPWWLPFDFVLVRIRDAGYRTRVTIARNSVVSNVYDLAVRVDGWSIVGLWEDAVPELPGLPTMIVPPPPRYSNERIINGIRYIYHGRYRCSVEDWESGKPRWKFSKPARKVKQPNR